MKVKISWAQKFPLVPEGHLMDFFLPWHIFCIVPWCLGVEPRWPSCMIRKAQVSRPKKVTLLGGFQNFFHLNPLGLRWIFFQGGAWGACETKIIIPRHAVCLYDVEGGHASRSLYNNKPELRPKFTQVVVSNIMFTPTWGNDPIKLIFFKWVETTNQLPYDFSWHILHDGTVPAKDLFQARHLGL